MQLPVAHMLLGQVRGLYDDVEEHFLRSHLEAPAVNAVATWP